MKKLISGIICLVLLCAVVGCAKNDNIKGKPNNESAIETQTPIQPPEEETETPQEELPQVSKPQAPSEPQVPEEVKRDVLLSSTTDGLRVRAGAGTSYSALGTLDKNDMTAFTDKVGEWYKVPYYNTYGYVHSSYVKTVSFDIGSDAVEKVIAEGKKLLGIPYEYGAQRYHWGNGVLNSSYTGKTYDCSSLMQYIFKKGANVNLDLTARSQSLQGTYVPRSEIRRGDLLFFTNASRVNNTGLERIGHVALYLGDNIILHTASDHAVIEPISTQRSAYYITARRII